MKKMFSSLLAIFFILQLGVMGSAMASSAMSKMPCHSKHCHSCDDIKFIGSLSSLPAEKKLKFSPFFLENISFDEKEIQLLSQIPKIFQEKIFAPPGYIQQKKIIVMRI